LPSTTQTKSGIAGQLSGAATATLDWLTTRFNNIDIFDEHYVAEAKTNPFYALGSIFYLVWFIVMLTGLVLIMWYIPTKAGAYNSILDIQHHIPFGGLMRGMHKYGADAMIIAATMRMFRMFLAGDYKPGKEFNIAIGLITLLLSMYSGLTGYLLIWNQRAYWATKVFATFPTYMDQFPVMGDFYQPLVKSVHMGWNTAEFLLGGGAAITQETITRFFSLHLAFSLIPLIFVELYFYRTGFKRMSINWTKRIIVGLMLMVVAIVLPAAIGARSNPEVTPLPILSDWYFLGLYQMYKYLEPVVATEITMLIPLSVIFLPFIDVAVTGPEKDIWKRPLVLMTTIMGAINWVLFSWLIIIGIANIHNDPPYWRDFLFLMVNFGMVWQLVLFWQNKDARQHLVNAKGALVMAAFCAIQSVFAGFYYYMAKTEMQFSPITQSMAFFIAKPLMGESGDKAVSLVKAVFKDNPDYWHAPYLLASGGDVPGKDLVVQINQVCQQPTPVDFIFQAIPSFTATPESTMEALKAQGAPVPPDLYSTAAFPVENAKYGIGNLPWYRYRGLIDYMVTNRWCFDYATFCDRMNGVMGPFNTALVTDANKPTYPMPVPGLDWLWMLGGLFTMAACIYTNWWAKRQANAAKPAEPPKVATPVA
jgi:quinol-cytochrome oxidoreductase complex cytochrome b subunit